MRDRLPVLIGIPAILIVLLAWYFGDLRRPSSLRRPAHVPRHDVGSPPVRRALGEVDVLRRLRQERRIPMGGVGDGEYQDSLGRLAAEAEETLHYLEALVLDRSEDLGLRVDLLNVIARHRGEKTRLFLSSLVLDSEEADALRIAAIAALRSYRDDPTFAVLRDAYLDPAPFAGRYHLCSALGESGHPDAVPLLVKASSEGATDVRAHAVAGLGGFADDPAVVQHLLRLADFEEFAPVRLNAVRALSRSSRPEAETYLRSLASSSDGDPEARRLAEALLQTPGKSR